MIDVISILTPKINLKRTRTNQYIKEKENRSKKKGEKNTERAEEGLKEPLVGWR